MGFSVIVGLCGETSGACNLCQVLFSGNCPSCAAAVVITAKRGSRQQLCPTGPVGECPVSQARNLPTLPLKLTASCCCPVTRARFTSRGGQQPPCTERATFLRSLGPSESKHFATWYCVQAER